MVTTRHTNMSYPEANPTSNPNAPPPSVPGTSHPNTNIHNPSIAGSSNPTPALIQQTPEGYVPREQFEALQKQVSSLVALLSARPEFAETQPQVHYQAPSAEYAPRVSQTHVRAPELAQPEYYSESTHHRARPEPVIERKAQEAASRPPVPSSYSDISPLSDIVL